MRPSDSPGASSAYNRSADNGPHQGPFGVWVPRKGKDGLTLVLPPSDLSLDKYSLQQLKSVLVSRRWNCDGNKPELLRRVTDLFNLEQQATYGGGRIADHDNIEFKDRGPAKSSDRTDEWIPLLTKAFSSEGWITGAFDVGMRSPQLDAVVVETWRQKVGLSGRKQKEAKGKLLDIASLEQHEFQFHPG